MRIIVYLEVSQESNKIDVTMDDLNTTFEEFQALTKEERLEKIQDFINESPNQPYWIVDRFFF